MGKPGGEVSAIFPQVVLRLPSTILWAAALSQARLLFFRGRFHS